MWVLPIFSPTVMTILRQPIIAPSPRAIATATFTQSGMNFVAASRFLVGVEFAHLLTRQIVSLSFIKRRIASEARYIVSRVNAYDYCQRIMTIVTGYETFVLSHSIGICCKTIRH